MTTLYFCSHDGNPRKVYKSDELAKQWSEQGNLYFATEVTYNANNQIALVNGEDFDDFVEGCADEKGTNEFNRVKSCLEKDWQFTTLTDD